MADKTKIEWTDATWNPITGCSIVSPGCTNCYAMKLAGRRLKHIKSRKGLTKDTKAGPVWTGEVRFNEEWLDHPLRWKTPRMIFVCAHGDLFHESVPFGWVMRVLYVMGQTHQHTYQILTKRPDRMAEFFTQWADVDPVNDWDFKDARGPDEVRQAHKSGRGQLFADMLDAMGPQPPGAAFPTFDWAGGMSRWPDVLRNIWLGTSIEDDARAVARVRPMADLAKDGWLTWVSYEPALGPVNWNDWTFLRWMVAGGESGNGARPMHLDWARSARDHCASAGIAFHFKQWGAWLPGEIYSRSEGESLIGGLVRHQDGSIDQHGGQSDHWWSGDCFGGVISTNVGKKAAGRALDGVTHDAFPIVETK